jgi:hypothetical protein
VGGDLLEMPWWRGGKKRLAARILAGGDFEGAVKPLMLAGAPTCLFDIRSIWDPKDTDSLYMHRGTSI